MTLHTEAERFRDNYQEALSALEMIRAWLEDRFVGVLPSHEAVLYLYGPEAHHEAEAIIAGLERLLEPKNLGH